MLFPFTSKFLYSNSSIWSSLNKKQLFLDKVTYMNSKWGVKQRSINEAAMWVGASRFGSLVMWSHIRMKMFVSLDILTEDPLAPSCSEGLHSAKATAMSKTGNKEIFEVGPYITKTTTAAKKTKKLHLFKRSIVTQCWAGNKMFVYLSFCAYCLCLEMSTYKFTLNCFSHIKLIWNCVA